MNRKRRIPVLIGGALVVFVTAMAPAGCTVEPPGIVYVRMAPPPPEMEAIGVAPGDGYVWIGGHHAWNGEAYVWVPGRWALRQHGYDHWVPGRWEHDSHGWFWVEGHWK